MQSHADLIETLEKTDILKDDIQTTRMQLGERWDHKNGHRIRAGFFAASTISFKLIDFQNTRHSGRNRPDSRE